MILYRRPTQLALRAALLLALEPKGTSRRVRELAECMDVPATYLAKVLQSLTHAGILESVRGPGGGVRLARPASQIALWDILSLLEPVDEYEHCLIGLGRCNDLNPCPLHEQWGPIREQLIQSLQSMDLEQFARAAEAKGLLREPAAGANSKTSSSSPEVQQ